MSILFLVSSCASGGGPGRLKPVNELTQELPKEMIDKFKVEESTVEIVPSHPEPVHLATEKKRIKKKKPIPKIGGIFEYPNRRVSPDPIWVGEKLVYDLTYFGVLAGTFTLQTQPYKVINQRKVYHIEGLVKTSRVFDLVYRVNDSVESFLDYEGLFSHRFHLVLDESKQTRDALELYDSEKKQAYYWNRWNHYKKGYSESKEFLPMQPFPQDAVSGLYYLRTLPIAVGKSPKFPFVTEGKSWETTLVGVRTEVIDSPMGKIKTIVVRPETRFEGKIKETGDVQAWITDDDRKILVRVEAKIKIGVVVAQLKEAQLGQKPE